VRNKRDGMEDYSEVQWGLYRGYMRETLDYTIAIIPLTIIPVTQKRYLYSIFLKQ
jgi:hypothetical protein